MSQIIIRTYPSLTQPKFIFEAGELHTWNETWAVSMFWMKKQCSNNIHHSSSAFWWKETFNECVSHIFFPTDSHQEGKQNKSFDNTKTIISHPTEKGSQTDLTSRGPYYKFYKTVTYNLFQWSSLFLNEILGQRHILRILKRSPKLVRFCGIFST